MRSATSNASRSRRRRRITQDLGDKSYLHADHMHELHDMTLLGNAFPNPWIASFENRDNKTRPAGNSLTPSLTRSMNERTIAHHFIFFLIFIIWDGAAVWSSSIDFGARFDHFAIYMTQTWLYLHWKNGTSKLHTRFRRLDRLWKNHLSWLEIVNPTSCHFNVTRIGAGMQNLYEVIVEDTLFFSLLASGFTIGKSYVENLD